MPKMFAMVCFNDGDARVYRYIKAHDEIVNLPMGMRYPRTNSVGPPDYEGIRATHIEFGVSKKLLITMARMARRGRWAEDPEIESVDLTQ